MAIRLVAVDVDGTLLTADQRVLPRVKDAVQLAVDHGIQLVQHRALVRGMLVRS